MYYFPLFGNSWDPGSDAPSSNGEEDALIRHALTSLDSSLQAQEAYASARSAIALKHYAYANQRIKQFASRLEKLLIWCFFIRRKSPFSLNPKDLEDFFSFCRQPPKDMVRSKIHCKRFIIEADEVCVNPQWKPFWSRSNHGLLNDQERSAIRFFYDYLKRQGISDIVPIRKPWLEKEHASPVVSSAIDVLQRYLQALQSGEICGSKPRARRSSKEKQVFVFATCYLLRIPFAFLVRSAQFFSMACFSCSSDKPSFVKINGEDEIIYRELTDDYLNVLYAFRQRIGLIGPPQDDEVQPIFRSPHSLHHIWSSLPIFDFMEAPLSEYLRELMRQQEIHTGDGIELRDAMVRSHIKKGASKESAYSRRCRQAVRVAQGITTLATKNCFSYRSNALPPPLCTFRSGKDRSLIYADLSEAVSRVKVAIGDLSVTDMKNLELFVYYANSARGQRNRYKIKALEKLTVWCIFIRPADIGCLTHEQAINFFSFCTEPPPSWCSGAPSRRFNALLGLSEWHPFKNVKSIEAAHLRAAHLVCWCSAVAQDLIDDGQIKSNGFASLSKELQSLWLH